MTSGAGFSYPYSVATDSSGDVYVGQYWIRGIKKMTYSTKKMIPALQVMVLIEEVVIVELIIH